MLSSPEFCVENIPPPCLWGPFIFRKWNFDFKHFSHLTLYWRGKRSCVALEKQSPFPPLKLFLCLNVMSSALVSERKRKGEGGTGTKANPRHGKNVPNSSSASKKNKGGWPQWQEIEQKATVERQTQKLSLRCTHQQCRSQVEGASSTNPGCDYRLLLSCEYCLISSTLGYPGGKRKDAPSKEHFQHPSFCLLNYWLFKKIVLGVCFWDIDSFQAPTTAVCCQVQIWWNYMFWLVPLPTNQDSKSGCKYLFCRQENKPEF